MLTMLMSRVRASVKGLPIITNIGCNEAKNDPIKNPNRKREILCRPGTTPTSCNLSPSQRTNTIVRINAIMAAVIMERIDDQVVDKPFVNADVMAKAMAQLKQNSKTLTNVFIHFQPF